MGGKSMAVSWCTFKVWVWKLNRRIWALDCIGWVINRFAPSPSVEIPVVKHFSEIARSHKSFSVILKIQWLLWWDNRDFPGQVQTWQLIPNTKLMEFVAKGNRGSWSTDIIKKVSAICGQETQETNYNVITTFTSVEKTKVLGKDSFIVEHWHVLYYQWREKGERPKS